MATLAKNDGARGLWRKKAITGDARTDESLVGFIMFLSIAFLLTIFLATEQGGDPLRNFYERCIDREIARCEPAAWAYSAGASLSLNEQALAKVRFFRENRDRLIGLMEEEGIGKDPQRAEYFLHLAARNALPVSEAGDISGRPKEKVGGK